MFLIFYSRFNYVGLTFLRKKAAAAAKAKCSHEVRAFTRVTEILKWEISFVLIKKVKCIKIYWLKHFRRVIIIFVGAAAFLSSCVLPYPTNGVYM